jgi:TldD protein
MDAARTVRSIGCRLEGGRVKVPAAPCGLQSRSLYRDLGSHARLLTAPERWLCWAEWRVARAKDPRVSQVMAGLASEYDVVMVVRADGTLVPTCALWCARA